MSASRWATIACLLLSGRTLSADDQHLLRALVAQAAVALDARRLEAEAARADALAEANELRAGLLQAVSHDLRTPLASIKASISSLRQGDVTWSAEQTTEFLATIDEEADRLTQLVAALLDMSRIQAGVITAKLEPTSIDEVVGVALSSLGGRAHPVVMDVTTTSRWSAADPVLLARVVANLVDNAITWSPAGRPPRVEAGAIAGARRPPRGRRRPGHPARRRARRCSSPSSAWSTTAAAWASGWPSPGASPWPWVVSSPSRTRRAAAPPWWCAWWRRPGDAGCWWSTTRPRSCGPWRPT